MRNLVLLLIILSSYCGFSQTYTLVTTVTSIEKIEGTVNVGLFNTPESFPKEGQEYRVLSAKVWGEKVTIVIDSLPLGDYALSLYHDVNDDSICNTNFIGIPKEDYGFSTNFKPKFKAPKFDDCKFTVKSDTSIIIRLLN